MILRSVATSQPVNAGRPTLPSGRQPVVERKYADPSSSPRSERYPVPYFYEYRVKTKEADPL